MQYHAKLEFGGAPHYWWNYSKEKMIDQILVPFVNGQVVMVKRKGRRHLLNMKNVTLLTAYRTPHKLIRPEGRRIPPELKADAIHQYACTDELLAEVKSDRAPQQLGSLLQLALAPPEPVVFVVMRFGDIQLDSAYEGVIRPTADAFGFKALRIDELQDSGKITDQVLEHIARSKYVLADLSGERPNCYYEAGFAHALGKQLILTIRRSDNIHFDLSGYRFIIWETEADFRRALRRRFADLERSGSEA